MDIRSITRTATIIYADSMSNRTTNTIKKKFVESVYVNNGNTLLTLSELVNIIEETMGLMFSEDEIKPIVKDESVFMEVLNRSSEDIKYNLQEKRYSTLCSKSIDEIDNVIETYFSAKVENSLSITKEGFKELMYRYLHSILNTNVSTYVQFVNPTKSVTIPKLNSEQFTDDEIDLINDFVKWNDETKNKAIFKLINYCIEYAIVVNNSSEDVLSKSLRTKVFYLDNALLYRALGINGETRKKRTISFLKKCKESGQKFVISKYTRQEFFNTVDYHLSQLNSSTPFGRITPRVFKRYANGDGFYQFYHEWRNGRINYGFDIFKTHIHSLYKDLVKQFDIEENFIVPFDEKEEPAIINTYKEEIQAIKKTNRNEPHMMDARNMHWIECIRNGNNIDVASTKYYFVTSDQKLQSWDRNHSVNQPLTLLPSQWMGLILKYVSRSSDDYKSFISFMNLPKDNSVILEDELQSVMAGISEMTEEFSKQESIIESMVEIKFGDILKGNIQENAKAYAKDKLEKEFEKQLVEKDKETDRRLSQKDQERKELEKLHQDILAQVREEAKERFEKAEIGRKQDKLLAINKEIGSLENRKANAESHAWNRIVWKKRIFTAVIVIPICIWLYIVYVYDWGIMEKKAYFPPLIYGIIMFVGAMIYGKDWNLQMYIDKLYKEYKDEEYLSFEYSESEYRELLEIREKLKQELGINKE